MKLIQKFTRYMNPSIDPRVAEDMDRRNLRSIRIISWLVLFFELAVFIMFLLSRMSSFDRSAMISTVTVCFSIVMCAFASLLSERMLKQEHLSHSHFFVFKIFFYIVFSAAAAVFDFRNYRAGNQMLTFYVVNLIMVCFILFKPWIGAFLITGSFIGLFIPMYIYNRAASIEPLNYIVFALASIASNSIRYHVQVHISTKTIQLTDANSALEVASHRDGLTGLQNRLALEEDAAHMSGRKMTVYMIDINYFKEINDRYGHVAGDTILRDVSAVLKHLFPGAHYYRYGGDEFLVLTYKPAEDNYGADTYDFVQEKYGVKVLLSIGNAQGSPDNYQELFELISRADKSLYVTKKRTHSVEFGGHDRRKARE